MKEAEAAYGAGLRGDFRLTDALLPRLADKGAVEHAWAWALSAQRWHAVPQPKRLPGPEQLSGFVGTAVAARRGATLACLEAERAAFLAFDHPRLAALLEVHRELVGSDDDVFLRFAACLARTLAGDAEQCRSEAEALEAAAAKGGVAPIVVEAAALRAYGALEAGDIEDATRNARRAVRMARTEELPQQQYFANTVLARLRRFGARPHLSIRILTSLARVVPVQWKTWVGWELLLAGGPKELDIAPWGHPSNPVAVERLHAPAELLSAARAGERSAFDEALVRARASLSAPMLLGDLSALAASVDPDAELEDVDEALKRWCAGHGALPPRGLLGAGVDWEAPGDQAVALVVARPDRTSRRVLTLGAGFLAPPLQTSRPGRIETLIAALALAGADGLDRDSLFAIVYNFEYDAGLHKGPFEVLLHRVRALLAETARIDRADLHLSLQVEAPFVVPDPRCAKPLGNKLLAVIARGGAASAKDAAAALKIPLRTAQLALKKLTEEGACELEKHGRRVTYRVEDTTFREPTRHS